MTISANRRLRLLLRGAALALSAAGALCAGKADAILFYEFIEKGADVELKVSGSLSGLPTPTELGTTNSGLSIDATNGRINTWGSATSGFDQYAISLDTGTVGFGTAGTINLTSYTGDRTRIRGDVAPSLRLPIGYTAGTSISGDGIFSGKTLADLGISESSLITRWAIGSDFIEISASIQPSPPAPVPGPLPLLGAAAAFAHSLRLRARLRGSSSPQA